MVGVGYTHQWQLHFDTVYFLLSFHIEWANTVLNYLPWIEMAGIHFIFKIPLLDYSK